MKQKWIVTLIFLVIISIGTVYSLFPLPDNTASVYLIIAASVFPLLTFAFLFGITKEMKAVFGSKWKRPFILFTGGFYLVVGVFLPILTGVIQVKVPWSYVIPVFLLLPIGYIALVLYRKFLMKNEGVLRNE